MHVYQKGKGPERENSPRCTNVGKMEPKTPQKKLAAREPNNSTTMETWGAIEKDTALKRNNNVNAYLCVRK